MKSQDTNPQETVKHTAHTPGPWESKNEGSCVMDEKGNMVAAVYPCELEPESIAIMTANAELIARAPQMLVELEQLRAEKERLREVLTETERYFYKKGAGGKWSKRIHEMIRAALGVDKKEQ